MSRLSPFLRRAALPLLLTAAVVAAWAQDTLRPAIATPALAAQQLLAAGQFREALAKVAEAEAVADRTPFENFVLDQLRGGAAAGAGDNEVAVRSFEAALRSGRLSAADSLPIIEGLVGTSVRLKDHSRTIEWGRRYVKEGGSKPQIRRALANALAQSGDTAGAVTELQALIAADEQAGRKPGEDLLRLLGASQLKLADNAGHLQTLERLLRHHPKPAYWRDRISALQSQPSFDSVLLVDSYRLLRAAGALEEGAEFVSIGELALLAGLPGEAQAVVDAGFAAGKLGAGADAAKHQNLRERAARAAAADARQLPAVPAPPASADGRSLVSLGLAYATSGRADAGITLLEQGIAKGGLPPRDLALARLRLAWLLATSATAERTAQAKPLFADLQTANGGLSGLGDLARLWLLHLDPPVGPR